MRSVITLEDKIALANRMRKNPTKAEAAMKRILLGTGMSFCSQVVLDPYIVDFIFVDRLLIIEVDGNTHNERRTYDKTRDASLLSYYSCRVLRLWNGKVLRDFRGTLNIIEQAYYKAQHNKGKLLFDKDLIEKGKVVTIKGPRKKKEERRHIQARLYSDEREREDQFEYAIYK